MKKKEIKNAIEDYLKPSKRSDYSRKVFHASESWKCSRRLIFKRLIPREPDREKWGHFKIGTALHNSLENYFKWNDDFEVDIEENWITSIEGITIICHPDIVHNKKKLPKSISEIKTTKNLRYVKEKPKQHHVTQLQTYLNVVHVNRGHIIYIQKTDFDYVIQEIKKDRDIFMGVVNKFKKVNSAIKEGKLLSGIGYDLGDWKCKFCPYNDICTKSMEEIQIKKERRESE